MDNTVNLQLCVPSETTPLKFYSEDLSDTLLEWYYHSVNATANPLQSLQELLTFLQHPSLCFSLIPDEKQYPIPKSELQLLNMVVFDNTATHPNYSEINTKRWIGPYRPAVGIEIPILDPSSIALVFQSSSGPLVWRSRQKFCGLPPTFRPPYLELTQKPGTAPGVPAHLCEVVSLGKKKSTAFILGNDLQMSMQPPYVISNPDLQSLYATQLNIIPHLQTLPPSLEITVNMCSRYFSPKIRRGYFRLSIQTETMSAPFLTEFNVAVPCSDANFEQTLRARILNFLAGYIQWSCLQKTYRQQGLTLTPKAFRWMLPDSNSTHSNGVSRTLYLQWDCRWPGGQARLAANTDAVVFGALPPPDGTAPDPLHALTSLWPQLQTLMDNHLLQQMIC